MSIIDREFLSKLDEFKKSHPGEYAFRGQADASWKLQSAATRRLNAQWIQDADINELINGEVQNIYHDYHRDELIKPSQTFGFDIEDGIEITDLQLLAKLQHFGAATGLIDFTWNPLIALWFACEKESDKDGKVFIINLNDPNKYESPSSREEEAMKCLFPTNKSKLLSLYWEPKIRSEAFARILRQHSVFVIPRSPTLEEGVKNIVIGQQHKEAIMGELAGMGISEQSLFLDIHGFSMTNRANSPIRRMSTIVPTSKKDASYDYFMRGNKFYQQGDYDNAIKCYTQCIDAIPTDSTVREPYYLRGNAKATIGDYKESIEDYDSADKGKIENMEGYRAGMKGNVVYDLEWDRPWIFFNRGNVKAELRKYEHAVQDYNKAIQAVMKLNSKSGIAMIKFNRANTNVILANTNEILEKYGEAIADYDEIINAKHEDSVHRKIALFNKGNTLVILCQFKEALQCYCKAIQSGYLGAEKNMKTLEKLVQHIGGAEYNCRINHQLNGPICVVVEIKDDNKTGENFPFNGNIGNIGNFGGNRLPGGEGYSGGLSFMVEVKSMKQTQGPPQPSE